MSKQYAYSFDDEYFGPCTFNSKEEALADARKEADADYLLVYIGEVNYYEEDCSGLANDIIETLRERAYDEVDDLADNYMDLTKEEEKILEERLKKVILDFQKEFGYEPTFFTVSDVETINL